MTAVTPVRSDAAQARSGSEQGYFVKTGDSLSKIAAEHGVSLAALIQANPQIANPNLIRPGQYISIPAHSGSQPAAQTTATSSSPTNDRFSFNSLADRLHIDPRVTAYVNDALKRLGQLIPGAGTGLPSTSAPSKPQTAPAKPATTNTNGAAATQAVDSATPKGEKERIQVAMDYFIGQGYTREQAAGLTANLYAESGLLANATGDGGSAKGIAQWHPDRQANFAKFIGHSIKDSTLGEQLRFVKHELDTTEKAAGKALLGAKTASQAAEVICRKYERPLNQDADSIKRAGYAEKFLADYNKTHP